MAICIYIYTYVHSKTEHITNSSRAGGRADRHACMHACIHACMHACMHAFIRIWDLVDLAWYGIVGLSVAGETRVERLMGEIVGGTDLLQHNDKKSKHHSKQYLLWDISIS